MSNGVNQGGLCSPEPHAKRARRADLTPAASSAPHNRRANQLTCNQTQRGRTRIPALLPGKAGKARVVEVRRREERFGRMAASRPELLTAAPYPNKASPWRRREQEVIKRGLSIDSIIPNSACPVSRASPLFNSPSLPANARLQTAILKRRHRSDGAFLK